MSVERNGNRERDAGVRIASELPAVADELRSRIERRLGELVPKATQHPETLHGAIRYSLLAGGKRLRPLLTMQVAREFVASAEAALDPACAIEMIHTASLILDDLPCMDDATLRRGQATNHRVFGEDTAILAATALLNRAFGVVAECENLSATARLDLMRLLSDAVGSDGIIAGQFCDLQGMRRDGEELADLKRMYTQKTGALFVASVEAGARIAEVDDTWVRAVREYAINLGLAFQILDDLIDVFGRPKNTGKDAGNDGQKTTVVSHLGAADAQLEVERYVRSAASALEPLGDSGASLIDLARSYTEPTMGRVLYL